MNLLRRVFDRRHAVTTEAPEERRKHTSQRADDRLEKAIDDLTQTAMSSKRMKITFAAFSDNCRWRYTNGSGTHRCGYGGEQTMVPCTQTFCPLLNEKK